LTYQGLLGRLLHHLLSPRPAAQAFSWISGAESTGRATMCWDPTLLYLIIRGSRVFDVFLHIILMLYIVVNRLAGDPQLIEGFLIGVKFRPTEAH